MNKDSISYKFKVRNIFIIVTMLAGIASSFAISFFTIKDIGLYPAVNDARILTKAASNYIEQNFDNRSFSELGTLKFKTQILDLKGNIIYNNYDSNSGSVNLNESLGYDMSFSALHENLAKYSCPIIVNQVQSGTAVFYIDKSVLFKDNLFEKIFMIFTPSFLALLVIAARLFIDTYEFRRKFINPIVELNNSADAIIKGDFDKKIKYNNDTEVGKLCASFEKMRDELKESTERERKLETSRKELITCISHDLRTPIASIKAYVDGIMDGIAKDQDTLFRYLSIINGKTQMLTKLINDLFEHCQTELDKLKIEKKEIYSGDFLRHIADELSLEFRNSSLEFEASSDMPNVLINIDRLRIEQVVYNLIQNAKKYTQDGGRITFGAEIEDDYLKVYVKDNGYGVDSKDLPFIFDKFYRGEKTRNSDKGGSGLGLSICKYIVEKHGGQIFVESDAAKGSSFYFVIPKV